MKIPELAQAAEAGVVDWSGPPDALNAAAVAAKLKFALVDLHGVGSKTELMAALAQGLGLPEHFGNNWDALADSLEDSDWLGAHGIAIALRHTKTFAGAHSADWSTLSEILGEAAEYWRELHKPFWVFVA